MTITKVSTIIPPSTRGWQTDGITLGYSYTCKCERAIRVLLDPINDDTWLHGGQILVQAPLATGKTALVELLTKVENVNVISISLLRLYKSYVEPTTNQFYDYLRSHMRVDPRKLRNDVDYNNSVLDIKERDFWDVIDDISIWKSPHKLVLVFDEAETILGLKFADHFFNGLKARQANPHTAVTASIFFSIYNIDIAIASLIALGKNPSDFVGNWVHVYSYSDILRWDFDEAMEFFTDFNKYNNSGIVITHSVCSEIYKKCDGHAGFITIVTQGINQYCKSEDKSVFDTELWIQYMCTWFLQNVKGLRSAYAIKNIFSSEKMRACAEICQTMILQPILNLKAENIHLHTLIKLGVVACIAEDKYTFCSQIIRMLVLREVAISS